VLTNPVIQTITRHFRRAYHPTRDNIILFLNPLLLAHKEGLMGNRRVHMSVSYLNKYLLNQSQCELSKLYVRHLTGKLGALIWASDINDYDSTVFCNMTPYSPSAFYML
jgi:hypothetical protein